MRSLRSVILRPIALAFTCVFFGLSPAVAQHARVTASEVLDRETLKAFVKSAREFAEGVTDKSQIEEFMEEEWNSGNIYIFLFNDEGDFIFHGTKPSYVGQNLIHLEDVNGVEIVKGIIAAAKSGVGYFEYYFDDPSVEGDEDLSSAKVAYAESFTMPDFFPDQILIIGSGFYTGDQVALDFAHFGNGAAITSDVVLVNVADQPVQPFVYFYNKAGELIPPESVVDVMGDLEVKEYGALTVQTALEPLAELTISTNGQGETVSGSVKVVSEGPESPIGGVLRFDILDVGVAGVGAGQPVRDAIFPARRVEGGINTGAAVRNLSESELTLTCRLMKDGAVLEDYEITLPANGQDSKFLHEMFEDTSDFVGSVRCTAPPGEQEFTGVAVELDADNRIFTTLPVVPVEREEMTSQEKSAQEY